MANRASNPSSSAPESVPFRQYLAEVRDIPLLTPKEEQALARAYRRTHDPRVAQLLVKSNLRFVIRVAREYCSGGMRLADLVQEGNLGLILAVERFDPDRDVRLVTYAASWIRARILNHILHSWSLVKIGTTAGQRRLFFSLARTRAELAKKVDPADQEAESKMGPMIARCLGVTTQAVEEMRNRLDGRDVYLDAPGPGGPTSPLSRVASTEEPQDVALSLAEESAGEVQRVRAALACLDDRERLVIELRVMHDEPLTLEEVGDRLGCGRERARQLEMRAKKKLRHCLDGCRPDLCSATRAVLLRNRRPATVAGRAG